MTDLSHVKIASLRERVSPQEWQARVDLAACYRLVALFGLNDLVYNHVTARLPGEDVIRLTHERYAPGQRRRITELERPALLRMLDRRDPTFRD